MTDVLLSLPWELIWPESIILLTAVIVVVIDLVLPIRIDRRWIYGVGLIGLSMSMLSMIAMFMKTEQDVSSLAGVFITDGFALLMKLFLSTALFFVLLLALDDHHVEWRKGQGEALALFLLSFLGAMVLVSATDFVLLFVALETLSIASYALVGFHRTRLTSLEGAFKYLISGAVATAFLAFGAALLVGITGTTNLWKMMQIMMLPELAYAQWLMLIGTVLVLGGLSFKLASFPFYSWVPDVYQGAPTAVTTFLAFVSKAAGFALLVHLFFIWRVASFQMPSYDHRLDTSIWMIFTIFAILSMFIGNGAALFQRDSKRLIAYSSIAHAGYMLLPFAVATQFSFEFFTYNQVLFYLFSYMWMILGIFAVIEMLAKERGTYDLEAFSGLYERSPLLALGVVVIVLSLAGIPLTAGFLGKWQIFMGAVINGHWMLGAILVVATIISYAYYFNILKYMFMRSSHTRQPLRLSVGTAIVFTVSVLVSILSGVFFEYVYAMIEHAFMFGVKSL